MSPQRALTCSLFLALVTSALGDHAEATEPVWRCTSAEGAAVSYQSTPCPTSGKALPSTKPPVAEDKAFSSAVAQREARLARTMARQRVRQENSLQKSAGSAHISLSGPVRQVSVGQRDGARPNLEPTRPKQGKRSSRQGGRELFRAEVPGRPRKSAQAEASAAPLP